jgi:hypothetical protein
MSALSIDQFRIITEVQNGSQSVAVTYDDAGVSFRFNQDSYLFPQTNATGPLVNDGNGILTFQSGFSGTYSTSEGKIVTVLNGIIISVIWNI